MMSGAEGGLDIGGVGALVAESGKERTLRGNVRIRGKDALPGPTGQDSGLHAASLMIVRLTGGIDVIIVVTGLAGCPGRRSLQVACAVWAFRDAPTCVGLRPVMRGCKIMS